MRNIPTDILRAFVTIIDLRGYTKAGDRLGRSQPAISLQMKRLQELLGVSLFDKDGNDTQLTEAGEVVAGYARRILALNDEMLLRISSRNSSGKLRLGIPNDYADHLLPTLMSDLKVDTTTLSFDVICDVSHELLKGLRSGLLDVAVVMTTDGPAEGALISWREPISWFGARIPQKSAISDPIRIVCYPEGCLYRRNMLGALQRDGRSFEIVYTSPSISGIEAAVSTDFGVTVLANRLAPKKLKRLEMPQTLPKLSDVIVGIYLNPKMDSKAARSIAARLADLFVDANSPLKTVHEPALAKIGAA
jgi:DNA-binding transcriptional LysR family regulator